MSDTVWLSQSAYDQLQAELEHLKTAGREEAAQAIKTARAHGDLRENAEYDSAKEEQGKMEARIRQLDDMLQRAQVGKAPAGDVVSGGSVVTTVDADGDEETFLIGSREDRTTGLTVVSTDSPLGRALVGARVGDEVRYEAPAGTFTLKITGLRGLEERV
ncbi:MAG: transcription elongation factor GreA [Actinobacteria bacterium]|nr:transcription elongation factor GreA [Actinomycetota bacterium]